jgi:hypothetical protein
MPLDISVIQGSILGPFCVLSMIFILSLLFSALFADNTTCLSKGKKLKDLIGFVKSELQKGVWFRANKMAVNTLKTQFIVFRACGKVINDRQMSSLAGYQSHPLRKFIWKP